MFTEISINCIIRRIVKFQSTKMLKLEKTLSSDHKIKLTYP